MGYYVQTRRVAFAIPKEKLEEALAALRKLAEHTDQLASGFSYTPDRGTSKHYAWMPDGWESGTLQEIMEHVGFDVEYDEEGNFHLGNYDSKTGDEQSFVYALAPFANPDWFIEWSGEDGRAFRWDAEGEKFGRVVFE